MSEEGDLIAVLPEVDATSYPLNEYQISFSACFAKSSSSSSMTSGTLSIGVMSDPNDSSTFEEVEELTISSAYSGFLYYFVRLNTYTSSGQYLAIKNVYSGNGYVYVDNVAVTELPSCYEPTNLSVDNDGLSAHVTWNGEGESFDIAYFMYAPTVAIPNIANGSVLPSISPTAHQISLSMMALV